MRTGSITDGQRIPVLTAREVGNRWIVWCSFCEAAHIHSPEAGYRRAPCHKEGSPYKETGYILKLEPGVKG